jgi:hypothetical protein
MCAVAVGITCMNFSRAHAHDVDAQEVALGSLVDAELAFARMGSSRGVREAFLANFAEDGVVFEPAPVRLRETWGARPAPTDPLAVTLAWSPAQAGVARSFDLGYTTGPYTLTSTAHPGAIRHGVFFSVWKRERGKPWQVLLDLGVATAAPVDFVALGAAPRPQFKGRATPGVERRRLLALEGSPLAANARARTPNAYAQLLGADARLHRNGSAPIAPRGEVAREMARRMSSVSWTPLDARVSNAADLAVTWGRYRQIDHTQQTQDGYYAHLWLRDVRGAWRLAYDIAVPESP